MAVNPRLAEVVGLLEAATDNNQLTWDASQYEDEFRAPTGAGSVTIAKHLVADEGVDARYILTVFNQTGQVIEDFTPTDPEEATLVGELYRKVRKAVLNLDFAWSAFLNDLKQRAANHSPPVHGSQGQPK